MFNCMFIAGMHLPTGDISYHLDMKEWSALIYGDIEVRTRAPKWDGHTPDDVVKRLENWLK